MIPCRSLPPRSDFRRITVWNPRLHIALYASAGASYSGRKVTSYYRPIGANEATLEVRSLLEGLAPGEGDLLEALHRDPAPLRLRAEGGDPGRVRSTCVCRPRGSTAPSPTTRSFARRRRRRRWSPGAAARPASSRAATTSASCSRRMLGCELGENTADNKLGLHLGQCNGTCDNAPQVWVNGKVVGPLTAADTVDLVKRAQGRARQPLRRARRLMPTYEQLVDQAAPARRRLEPPDRPRLAVCNRHVEHRGRRARDAGGAATGRRGRGRRRQRRPRRRQRPLVRQPGRRADDAGRRRASSIRRLKPQTPSTSSNRAREA